MAGLYLGAYDTGDVFLGTRSDDVRRNDVNLDTFFAGLDGDFVVSEVVIFGENRSSNCRLADINGSYLSDSPLDVCANPRTRYRIRNTNKLELKFRWCFAFT